MAWIDSSGYISLLHEGRQVREHRLVAERMLGRPLKPNEHVHHKNKVKTDTRPENLELVDNSSHVRHHWQEGHYDPRVKMQTKPDAECSRCGAFGRLRARGMCQKCYHRDYYERHPEKWKR